MGWWIDRKYKSPCRVCHSFIIQGYHWVSTEIDGSARKEECSPSDNLEYLEWCVAKKETHERACKKP